MDPPPPPPHPNNVDDPNRNDNQGAQNEAHGLNQGFNIFRPQVQLGRESAPPPPVVQREWVAGTSAWMGGTSPIYQDYLEQQRQPNLEQPSYLEQQWQAYLEQPRQPSYLEQLRQPYLAYFVHLDEQRQANLAYLACLEQQRQPHLQQQRQPYLDLQQQPYLAYLAYLDLQRQAYLAYLAYLEQQRQAYVAYLTQQQQAFVEQQLQAYLQQVLQAYLEQQQVLQAYLQQPVEVVQVNPPPVEVEHKVEVPSTVSSNPGLSENVRPESDAIASVESTVPCGDTSFPGTVESTETTTTNQENLPVEVEQQSPLVEVEQQPSPPVDVEVKDTNNPQAKSVPADPADGETLSSQEGICPFSSPGRGRGRGFGRGNYRQRSNASVQKTYEEHMKELEEKRRPLQALKAEERKVDPKEFESLQQLKGKKSNEGFYIKGSKD